MIYGFNAPNTYGFNSGQGFGFVGSQYLANIIYNMDVFNVDASSLRTIDNAGSDGSTSDAPMYTSNHIFLDGSTQSVDYPIPHTLGSELIINPWVEYGTNTLVDNLDGTFTCTMVDDHRMCESTGLIFEVGETYAIQKTIISDSTAGNIVVWDGVTAHILSNDSTTEYITATGTGGNIRFNEFTLGESVTFEIELQEITNQNSFLTYFDTATKSHVTVDNSISPSITYTQEDSHSNTFTTTAEVISADLTYLDANPESIARLVDGETVAGLSFDLTDIEAFYPCNEGAAETLGRVYDVTDQTFLTYSTIVNFVSTCRTNLDLTNYGASNLLYKQDATGRWLGMTDANLIEFTGDGRYADTGWVISPSESWTMEIVSYLDINGIQEIFGNGIGGIRFRKFSTGDMYAYIGGETYSLLASINDNLNHYIITFNGTNATVFINNTQGATETPTIIDNTDFLLGKDNLSTDYKRSPLGLFKVHKNKAMIAAEVAAAYTKAKLTYPTLP